MAELTVRNESGQTFKVDETKVSEAEKDGYLPVVTNGKDEHRVSYKDLEAAKADGYDLSKPRISKLESAARGFAQGASLNLADEATGGIQAVYEDLKNVFTGSQDPNAKKPTYDEFGRVTNSKDLGGNYEKYRDEARSNNKRAEEANPGSYKAGEVGGGLSAAAIPFGATTTLANAVRTGAKIGAVSAYGQSTSNNVADVIEEVGSGAAFGAAGGGLAKGVEKGIPLAKNLLRGQMNKAVKTGIETADSVASSELQRMPIDNPGVFKEAAVSAKNRINSFLNPKIDPSFEEFAAIAKKNGIDPRLLPESVKFGPDSSASRASRNLAEGRFGEETLKRFNETLDQVRGAYDKKIVNYSKGLPTDEMTAGKILRDSYDEGVSKFFDQMDLTHNTIMKQVPNLQVTPQALQKIESSINGLEKFAKGRQLRGVTETQRGQANQLLNAVGAIRAGNGSYKQTVEALRDIGEAAFQSKNSMADIPVDVQKMRKIYNDLNEGLIDSVRSQLGDDIADSLVSNNKMMHEFFGDKSLVSQIMGDKSIAPENAFKSLILNGDSQKLQALRKVISPEKWDYLKGAVLENLTKRDAESNFTFKQLHNAMRNKKSALSTIFTPEELAENAGLVRLGDRFGNPVLSSSGTGASLSFQDLYQVPANLSVDAIALRNANKAAEKVLNKSPEAAVKAARDVSPTLKSIPAKVAGAMAATGGPEKWANDGANKLQQSGLDPDQIEQLKKSKSGRDLLIEASDAKPNSKRMDSVLKRIRTGEFKEAQ